jgi:membrane-bound ClpP family serine protease
MKYLDKKLLYKVFVIYIGTICMMAGPFFVNGLSGKLMMIVGLALLTIQTQKTKSYNLSLLNAVGICGYLYSIFS